MTDATRTNGPLNHTVTDIDGKTVDLRSFGGRVVLFVNVASECGFTPQYEDLEKLWNRYRDRGLTVLGFPANDFGAQEPGTDQEIRAFCTTRYDVSFPLFSKIAVTGPDRSPVYAALAAVGGEPKWNFHKYLVGRNGEVIRGFPSSVAPLSDELVGAIEEALG